MKRIVIGAILLLTGAVWLIVLSLFILNNITTSWTSPPGRFISTLIELDMTNLFIIPIFLFVLGLIILVIEYFSKSKD